MLTALEEFVVIKSLLLATLLWLIVKNLLDKLCVALRVNTVSHLCVDTWATVRRLSIGWISRRTIVAAVQVYLWVGDKAHWAVEDSSRSAGSFLILTSGIENLPFLSEYSTNVLVGESFHLNSVSRWNLLATSRSEIFWDADLLHFWEVMSWNAWVRALIRRHISGAIFPSCRLSLFLITILIDFDWVSKVMLLVNNNFIIIERLALLID